MSKKWLYVSSLALVFTIASAIFAANKNFVPDVTFKGSALTGWHTLGHADWRAHDGEIAAWPVDRLVTLIREFRGSVR